MSHATGSHGRPPSRAHAPTRRPWPSFLKLEEASISILSDDDALINPKAEFVIPGLIQKRKRLAFFKLAREPSQRLARRCRPSWPPPSTDRLRDDASACQCACRRTNRAFAHAEGLQLLALSCQPAEPTSLDQSASMTEIVIERAVWPSRRDLA